MTVKGILKSIGVALLAALILGAGALWWLVSDPHVPEPKPGTLTITAQNGVYEAGDFRIEIRGGDEPLFRVWHKDRPDEPVWRNPKGHAFLGAMESDVTFTKGHSFRPRIKTEYECEDQSVDFAGPTLEGVRSVTVSGTLTCSDKSRQYRLDLAQIGPNAIHIQDWPLPPPSRDSTEVVYPNSLRLFAASPSNEAVFGFGIQFGRFNVKGRRLPIYTVEQGIGRGSQPLTLLADLLGDNAGGRWYHSYAPASRFITNKNRGFVSVQDTLTVFDLRPDDYMAIDFHAGTVGGTFFSGSPLGVVEAIPQSTNWMPTPLPDWIQQGAVLGLQGGTKVVREKIKAAQDAGVPIAGVWLQDWVGQRTTSFGKQLWWNWVLDRNHYPDWEELVADLEAEGIRVLTYVNPYLADVTEAGDGRRNLFAEARDLGYLVKGADGAPVMVKNTSFKFGIVDLENSEAADWYRALLIKTAARLGVSGWMADFGEAYPIDTTHENAQKNNVETIGEAVYLHNDYPRHWAYLNYRVMLAQDTPEDFVFFMRAGGSATPGIAPLMWLGDQMVTWDEHDGLKSVVPGLTSAGASGYAYVHSDIGGYTTLTNPLKSYTRSAELFQRWAELAAFTPVFRTHEGNRPDANHQFDSSPETLAHFAKMAQLYACLAPYRARLTQEAMQTNAPMLRAPLLHYPGNREFQAMSHEQFMLGADIMVVPVQDPSTDHVKAYFADGPWEHLWTGKSYGAGLHTVAAPIGEPPAFIRAASRVLSELKACALN